MSAALLVLVLAMTTPAAPTAEQARCDTAFQELNGLQSWTDLYRVWKRFPECDDGGIAEGYSEFVVHTLATRWGTLGQAMKLTKGDVKFRAFVLEHIDATTDPDDLSRVMVNAKKHRPRGGATLCREISKRAQAALDDMGSADRP